MSGKLAVVAMSGNTAEVAERIISCRQVSSPFSLEEQDTPVLYTIIYMVYYIQF